jgi:adenosylmethionine-8-amino-7-oxononanoate aminotransferase
LTHETTPAAGPTAGLPERDAAVCWHPYTQHALEPRQLPVAKAQGAWLELTDGRRVLDGISSWWATLHGHGHPRLVEALRTQLETLDHVLFGGATHEPAVRLAERLIEIAPPGLTRAFYSDNGSTAIEVALKMVLQRWVHEGQPERRVIVALDHAYHGDTFGAMAVGDPDPFFLPFAPFLFEVKRVAPTNDAVEGALRELGGRAAGVILEPLLQGAAGMLVQTTAFVQGVRTSCDAHGVPLIADEVLTGFGRVGARFACERAGVAPDLMCLAKGLTGGMFPMSVTLATEAFFEAFLAEDKGKAFFHGHTFTAHPGGCAVGLASLDLLLEDDVPARMEAIGTRILDGVRSVADHPRVREVRGIGGIAAIELEPESGGGGYLASQAPRLRAAALERGVLLRPLGNVLYAMPPACTTDDEADRIAAVMVELVDA